MKKVKAWLHKKSYMWIGDGRYRACDVYKCPSCGSVQVDMTGDGGLPLKHCPECGEKLSLDG